MPVDKSFGSTEPQPPAEAANLRLDPSGIWVSREAREISYPTDGNELCFAVEEKSFWFKHRNAVIVEVLRRFPPPGLFFDIGGGNGFVASAIESAGWPTVVVEPGMAGAQNARSRGVRHVVCASTDTAGFPPSSFPAVGLFDVLEHIEDHLTFLHSLRRLMQRGGRIYITVPAFNGLWSAEDVSAGHFRRYTTTTLRDVLAAAGFEIEYQSYFFSLLPPLVFLLRTIPSRLGVTHRESRAAMEREHTGGSETMSRMLLRALTLEQRWIGASRKVPVGTSCVAVARLST
jgi:SAM-dependent methyltransferase